MKLISDEKLKEAWDDAFKKPVFLNYKPSKDSILLIRLRSVAYAQLKADKEDKS